MFVLDFHSSNLLRGVGCGSLMNNAQVIEQSFVFWVDELSAVISLNVFHCGVEMVSNHFEESVYGCVDLFAEW